MYERLKDCPICLHNDFTNFIICKDHLVTEESFAIVQCNNCGLKFTNPRPTLENIAKYYDSEEYDSHKKKSSGLVDIVYNVARSYSLKKKIALINSLQPEKGKILDIGCGTGHFLGYCENNDWETVGVEFNDKAKSIASELINGTIYSCLDEIESKKEFQVITLWHVLEHLHDLHGTLKKIRKLLMKNGSLIIAVPNSDSWDCNYYKSIWAGYDVPRHLYHFNKLTINILAKEYKYKVQHIVPMKLDAFYVSLLSEKYAHGKNRFFKAFNSGLKSNRWAKKNQDNYSSLIYILTKK